MINLYKSVVGFSVKQQNKTKVEFSITGYEEFIVDGVIVLRLTSSVPGGIGAYTRSLFIRKMRGTHHSLESVPMEFNQSGIEVYPSAKVF